MAVLLRFLEWWSVRKRAADLVALRAMISPSPGMRLLDVGGGGGGATERFASGCGQVVVLEPDPRKLAMGGRRHPSFRFEPGKGEAIPFPDGTFDWVVSIVALHHMEDPEKAMREMHRVLGPHGRVALLELSPSRAPGPLARRLLVGHGERLAFHEPGQWAAKLEAAGFRDVEWARGATTTFVTGAK